MDASRFIELCSLCGFCSSDIAVNYCESIGDIHKVYTQEDIYVVHRIELKALCEGLKNNEKYRDLGRGCRTTKQYPKESEW